MLAYKQFAQVIPGDLFICIPEPDLEVGEEVAEALQRGAAAVMTVDTFETDEDVEVPVMLVDDCSKAQQLLGAAFYDYPSEKMKVVAVTGMHISHAADMSNSCCLSGLLPGNGHHFCFAFSGCST